MEFYFEKLKSIDDNKSKSFLYLLDIHNWQTLYKYINSANTHKKVTRKKPISSLHKFEMEAHRN